MEEDYSIKNATEAAVNELLLSWKTDQCCARRVSEVAVADRKLWESRERLSTAKRPQLCAVPGSQYSTVGSSGAYAIP